MMNSTKFLDRLLQGQKVEWKRLGEVAEIFGGLNGKSKEDFGNGNAQYIPYKNIFFNPAVNFNNLERVKISETEKQNKVKYGDILFTASSETADEVGISSAITTYIDEPIYLNSFCFGVRFKKEILLLPEFSKHLFRANFMRNEIVKTASGVTRFNISKERFKKLLIPIPPLAVQKEIVRILDTFTELTTALKAELEAELTARKKQYDYYREQLLMVNDKGLMNGQPVVWKTLGEVLLMKAGQHISAENINTNQDDVYKFPCFGGHGVRGYVKKYSHDGEYVFIGRQGALCGNVQRYKGKFYATEHAVVVSSNPTLNIDYVFYFLTIMNLNQYASKSAQPGLAVSNLSSLKIPIPPLEEQNRIVSILDKFDTLTTSISEGLPKEIELRQKQYEYYRNQLLMFNG